MPNVSTLFSLGSLAFLLFSTFQSVPFQDLHPIEEVIKTYTVSDSEIEQARKIEEYLKNKVPGLDQTYRDIFNLIIKEGYNVWLTGGAIRDLLANDPNTPNDIDFTFDCSLEEMKKILLKNGIPYIIPKTIVLNIGLKNSVRMEGLESIYAFHSSDEELEFTMNSIHYHLNTALFEPRFKKGLEDLKDKKIIVNAKNLNIWLYEGQCGRPVKIIRYWKMRGKGYHSCAQLERFITFEAIKFFKRDPETFRAHLLNYLGNHFSCFYQIRKGCIQTMGLKWTRENLDSLYIKAQAIDKDIEILWNTQTIHAQKKKIEILDHLDSFLERQ